MVTGRGKPPVDWRSLAAKTIKAGSTNTLVTKTRVVVAEPVWDDNGHNDSPVGVVVLERPTAQLNDNTSGLWLYVGLLAAIAMLAAAAIAVTFAQWVGKPLVTMDAAARKLADGDLSVRAASGSGPPELRRMAATFNMMAGRLETLVHGHRAMLADVSHQLRTPLAALRLRIDLLAVDAGPTAQAGFAGAQEEIARLSRLVDGLLATARAESVTEQRIVINLLPTVAERVAAWQPVAAGSGVKLVTDPSCRCRRGWRTAGRGRCRAHRADPRQPARQRDRGAPRRRPGHGQRVRGGSRRAARRRRRRPRDVPGGAGSRLHAVLRR